VALQTSTVEVVSTYVYVRFLPASNRATRPAHRIHQDVKTISMLRTLTRHEFTHLPAPFLPFIGLHISLVRGGVVVEALRYKPEGRGFDSRLCHWIFSFT
jgi:hypothetical protein